MSGNGLGSHQTQTGGETNCSGNVTLTDTLDIPYTVCEILVAITAVIGNALVILVFWKEKKLRRKTKYYIISLAVADFLVGLVGVPFAILASIGQPKHLHLCLFTVSLLVVLCTISIFCLVAVSIDRYWAILHPMSYSQNVSSKTTVWIIVVCWVSGACVGFLPLMGWNNGGCEEQLCLFSKVMDHRYLVFLYFATIIVPALLLAAFYAHIYTVILNQLRRIVFFCPGDQNTARSSGMMCRVLGAAQKREVKVTQNLSVIVLFFIICWIPLYTINAIEAFCDKCEAPKYITSSFIILSHLNSSINPFLYAYHLKDFRKALKNFFVCGDKANDIGTPRNPADRSPKKIREIDQRPAPNGVLVHKTDCFGIEFSSFVFIDGGEEATCD